MLRHNRDEGDHLPDGVALSPLLEGLLDPAFVIDRNSMVIAANGLAQSLMGAKPGLPVVAFCRAPGLLTAISQAIATGEIQNSEVELIVPTEHTLRVRVTSLAPTPSFTDPAVLIVLRDTTEEAQLAQMRADFVANASHELRTPLASLSGFVETLRGAAKDDPAARDKFLGIMQAQAFRMTRLIEDLLSLSRIEMREHLAPRDAVDLTSVIDHTARALTPLARDAGIEIRVEGGPERLIVIGDRDELVQVANNLMQNAIKYGREGGHVTARLSADASTVRLDVVDDGIGIAPEHLPRLTERFYRVSAKESRERGGTGLGLAIVKHIVRRHRGRLDIRSTRGVGSTFSVTLPRQISS